MSLEEAPLSIRATDQAWFSMLLANDPNTALLGSLRPSRRHPFWVEPIPGLRSGSARWIGALLVLVLGAGFVVTLTPPAAFRSEELSAVTLPVRAAPSPPLAVNVASSSAGSSRVSSGGTPDWASKEAVTSNTAVAAQAAVAVTAQVAAPTPSAKKKAAARRSEARRSARRRAAAH